MSKNLIHINSTVICTDASDWEDCLTVGKEYRVQDIEPVMNPETKKADMEEFKILDDTGILFYFDSNRFKPKLDH